MGLFFFPKKPDDEWRDLLAGVARPPGPLHADPEQQVFLQDGGPCHTSKRIIAFLRAKGEFFSILDGPGNSPDLKTQLKMFAPT